MPTDADATMPVLGVAIVAYNSADVIAGCLASLIDSRGVRLRIVVVDNCSTDGTPTVIRGWAAAEAGRIAFAERATAEPAGLPLARPAAAAFDLTFATAPVNRGFAWGTNRALELLLGDSAIDLFWLLNPDARARPDTARAFARAGADGAFALMGGRICRADAPELVQTDGGRVSRLTGVCRSLNAGARAAGTALPPADALDFVSGASCVASRRFIAAAGLLREDYFLYYEEVDWAFRRGDLPLRVVPQALTDHIGGSAIGSGGPGRRPSALANFFIARSRRRFLARFGPGFGPWCVPLALAHGLAKALQLVVLGAPGEAMALLAGLFGLPPARAVRARLAPEARETAFRRGGS